MIKNTEDAIMETLNDIHNLYLRILDTRDLSDAVRNIVYTTLKNIEELLSVYKKKNGI